MTARCLKPPMNWLMLLLTGCSSGLAQPEAAKPAPPTSEAATDGPLHPGTIRGTVRWVGEIPRVAPYAIAPVDAAVGPAHGALVRDNPNAPRIDPNTRGVAGAVVYLKAVDPKQARRWDHPPVHLEQADFQLRVAQRPGESRVGFVRRGDAVEMVSHQPVLHALHAEGAAFFTLSFPRPEQPLLRRLDRSGLVEFRSAATYYWMRAYVFVCDHPYYTTTDESGRFELAEVPPGDYEIVCWHPDWREAHRDLDPESWIVLRLFYQPPLVVARQLHLDADEQIDIPLELSAPSDRTLRRRKE